jgi:hypothetical protein
MDGDASLRAVNESPVGVEIETERQRTRVSHVARADGLDLRFGSVAVGGQADEVIREQRGDGSLRDDALDEGTAVSSSVTPVLDEDELPRASRFDQRIRQARVPAHRAAVVEMWM